MTGYPRYGVPSASGMHRVFNCPASFQMEQMASEKVETAQQETWSESGDDVHLYMEGMKPYDELDSQQQQTTDMITRDYEALYAEWMAGIGREDWPTLEFKELRLGITMSGNVIDVKPESTARFQFTGQMDRIVIVGDQAFVPDYKSLSGKHEQALNNAQCMSQAVLVWKRFNVPNVRVALIQPWCGKPSTADFTVTELRSAERWLMNALERERTSTPEDTVVGDWCLWCKAKLNCQKFQDAQYAKLEVVNPMQIAGLPGKEQRQAMFARAMELPAAQLAAARRGIPMLERFVDSIKAASLARGETDPEFQQYYTVEESQGDREFKGEAHQVQAALAELGVTAQDIIESAKLSVTKVQDKVRKRSGIKSQTAKRTTYNLTADGAAEAMQNAAGPLLGRAAPSKKLVPVNRLEGGDE